MLATTSLSVAANSLRSFLDTNIQDLDAIFISHPKEAVEQTGEEGKQYLNLFFYQVEHAGYPADGLSEDPFYVRVNCLITALATKETGEGNGGVSAGENDLRLIGEVLRLLHEHPVLMVTEEEQKAQLQVVLLPLTLDDINHLWSNQGDVPYRLSVAYQMSLLPIPLGEAKRSSPLVGAIGARVQGDLTRPPLPEGGFGISAASPAVDRMEIDISRSDWTPQLAWLDGTGILCYTLSFALSAIPVQIDVLIVGIPGENVTLVWEQWDAAAQPIPWRPVGAEETLPAKTAVIEADQTEPPLASLAQGVAPPITVKGQAVFYAKREWVRPDGRSVVLRSNPLLVIVHEGG